MTLKLKSLALIVVALAASAILSGCNDVLRQFIITVPKPGGQPATQTNAVILSTNPAGNGSTMHLNVSGDNIAALVQVGVNPVFLGKAGSEAVIINGDGTLSSYLWPSALGATIHTAVLPSTSSGAIGGGTSSSGNFFIADSSSNDLNVWTSGVGAVTETVPLTGSAPVLVAGNAANSKAYVINNSSNNVTVLSTIDNTVIKTIPVGVSPIWGVMSADAVDVFVVNQGDGTVMVIDTTLDQVIPCSANAVPGSCNNGAISVGTSPNFAFFDPNRQRLYVTNSGENTISVIKADGLNLGVTPQIVPQLLAKIPVSGTPISVTALADGSKVYAALANCPAGTNHTNLVTGASNLANCKGNLVSVIDATSLHEIRTVQVGSGAVSVASSSDSTRVYAISALDTTTVFDTVHNPSCTAQPCGPAPPPGHCTSSCIPGPLQDQIIPTPSVSIIRTSTDTIFASTPPPTDPSIVVSPFSFRVPLQNANCTPAVNPNVNPNVPIPCAGQTPFAVGMFP